MISQFSFKNFKSFKDETTFDFRATNIDDLKDTLIVDNQDGSKFLPVNVIYGPNGGGKTSLIQALSCVISLVVSPIYSLHKNHINNIIQHTIGYEPFLFDKTSATQPTEFNIYFRIGENEFRYYISLLNDEIVNEFLRRKSINGKKPATIFERTGTRVVLGTMLEKIISSSIGANPKMPYLSFLAINYDIPIITEVAKWFESCIIRNYSNPLVELTYTFFTDGKNKNLLLDSFKNMDIDISDYWFDEVSKKPIIQHIVENEPYELALDFESEGTKKLFAIMPIFLHALQEGRLVIVDELDAKLHPKLLKYIIMLFSNQTINKKGSQILFTSHDLCTMKNDVFRRDEIWFASLNNHRASTIFALSDVKKENGKIVNKTAAYDKQYIEGRYGADPYLGKMLEWED